MCKSRTRLGACYACTSDGRRGAYCCACLHFDYLESDSYWGIDFVIFKYQLYVDMPIICNCELLTTGFFLLAALDEVCRRFRNVILF
jgi:hypothetical protein